MKYLLIAPFLLFLLLFSAARAQTQSEMIDLSNNDWHIWLDKEATWLDDELFVKPDVSRLPVNPPTCGWDGLFDGRGTAVTLPATVEQYFWDENGNSRGISGNYVGVSWFFSSFEVPETWTGKHLWLDFESARLRAEVFVNNKLVGYDLINGTPFSVDISDAVKIGIGNTLAVRITDPSGNFAWRDWDAFLWGKNEIPPSHGFGGITGKVVLRATPDSYISDVYVKNMSDLNEVDVTFSLANLGAKPASGEIDFSITPLGESAPVFSKKLTVGSFENELALLNSVTLKNAKPWTPETPDLYLLNATWKGNDGAEHSFQRRFGFRYFEVKEINGDKQFFLNGKRIVLRTAISWGHWPVNGIFPTDELARKQIETAKELGLNMLNFHRGIGQQVVLDYADELGLLYYEEPGGYKPNDTKLLQEWKREKLLRMAKRDRNHPSLVIYNMINESTREPFPNELKDMADLHKIDENRIVTFTTTFFSKKFYDSKCPTTPAPFKSHMLPGDTTIYDYGWWDEHHAGGPGVYSDNFYNGPDKIYRHYDNPKEIIFLGEEGAIGTLPRLQLIKNELDKNSQYGWDGDAFLKQYDAIDGYLTKYGYRDAFPTMDAFTKNIGKVAYYYQGRTIENFRIGNTGDGYAVNGWESEKIENHSGIVDVFRNPKADPELLAYYNQPLYVAVKLRNKVIQLGELATCDFFMVNEKDLKGNFKLKVTVLNEEQIISEHVYPVKLTGGNCYGELILKDIDIQPEKDGYTSVYAVLLKGQQEVANGHDELFVVDFNPAKVEGNVAVVDTSGTIQKMLDISGIRNYTVYDKAPMPHENVMIVGETVQPGFIQGNFRQDDPILDWVAAGNTLVVVAGADNWAHYLEQKEVIEYRGRRDVDINWFGGNYFVRENPLFEGLPVNTAFNWEYQSLAAYKCTRFGLRLPDIESAVGVYADHKQEVYTAVAIVRVGKGKIILSTLDLKNSILTKEPASVVSKLLLVNYLSTK